MSCRIAIIIACLGSTATAQPVSDWPSAITCIGTSRLLCTEDARCEVSRFGKFPLKYVFNLSAKTFATSNVFEGQDVPNFAGKIIWQHERVPNHDYRQLALMLDAGQLVTFSPARDKQYRNLRGKYLAVVQYGMPGGSATDWFDCTSDMSVR